MDKWQAKCSVMREQRNFFADQWADALVENAQLNTRIAELEKPAEAEPSATE